MKKGKSVKNLTRNVSEINLKPEMAQTTTDFGHKCKIGKAKRNDAIFEESGLSTY